MAWAPLLACITGTVDQEWPLPNPDSRYQAASCAAIRFWHERSPHYVFLIDVNHLRCSQQTLGSKNCVVRRTVEHGIRGISHLRHSVASRHGHLQRRRH